MNSMIALLHASGGIGRATAVLCADKGARVGVHYNSNRQAAEELLRERRAQQEDADVDVLVLAATDPANPYGAALAWPKRRVPL